MSDREFRNIHSRCDNFVDIRKATCLITVRTLNTAVAVVRMRLL
jgi:hypothetical protein